MHSIGGRPLPLASRGEEVAAYKLRRWQEEWDETRRCFAKPEVNKVLEPMIPPPAFAGVSVGPLVVFWFAIHPTGGTEPFFSVPTDGAFREVSVFSMSAYLRGLSVDTVDLPANRADARMRRLGRLVEWSGA